MCGASTRGCRNTHCKRNDELGQAFESPQDICQTQRQSEDEDFALHSLQDEFEKTKRFAASDEQMLEFL